MYEVGVVYTKNGRLHLAVDEDKLLTFKNKKPDVIKPYTPDSYRILRNVSVADLCARWDVDSAVIDQATAAHLAPSQDGIKAAPRGSRAQHRLDLETWRYIRTVKIVKN